MAENVYVSDESWKFLNKLNDTLLGDIIDTVQAVAKQLDLREGETLDLIPVNLKEFEQGEAPLTIGMSTKEGVELGEATMSDDATVFAIYDNAKDNYEINNEIKDNYKKLKEKTESVSKEPIKNNTQHDLETAKDRTDRVLNNINKAMEKTGNKNMTDWLKEMRGETNVKSIRFELAERKEAINEYKETKQKIEELQKELKKQTKEGIELGMPKECETKIYKLAEKIEDATLEAAKLKEEIKPIKNIVIDRVKNFGEKTKTFVASTANKIIEGLAQKVNAGLKALQSLISAVEHTCEKAKVIGATAFASLDLTVEQIARDYIDLSYAIDSVVKDQVDKLYDVMGKAFDRVNTVKGAATDLGRAVIGKEVTGQKADVSEKQQKVLDTLDKTSRNIGDEMTSYAQLYKDSLEESENKYNKNNDSREKVGFKASDSMEKRMALAKAQARASKIPLDKNEIVPISDAR